MKMLPMLRSIGHIASTPEKSLKTHRDLINSATIKQSASVIARFQTQTESRPCTDHVRMPQCIARGTASFI